jgi:hypothetical protein
MTIDYFRVVMDHLAHLVQLDKKVTEDLKVCIAWMVQLVKKVNLVVMVFLVSLVWLDLLVHLEAAKAHLVHLDLLVQEVSEVCLDLKDWMVSLESVDLKVS